MREAAVMKNKALHIVQEAINQGYFPMASVSVFTARENLFRFALGGVREETLFDVASLTKIATSTQVLHFIDQGRLKLDDRIVDLLPDLLGSVELKERLKDVTIQRLLLHTASLPDWYPTYADGRDFPVMMKAAIFSMPPVEGMEYSDLNFMLLGKLLERLSGLPLDQCLQQHLVKPLNLGQMCYCPDEGQDIAPSSYGNPIEENMSREKGLGFERWRPHEPLVGQVNDGNAWYYFGGVAGHAGIFANSLAYERLAQHYMRTDSALLLQSMQELAPTRGLGWQVNDLYPHGCGHTGFTGTSIFLSREKDIGCVLLANRLFYRHSNEHSTHDIRRALHRALVEG